jgi:hypothetical protein
MKPSKPLYIINLDVYPNRNLSIDFVEEAKSLLSGQGRQWDEPGHEVGEREVALNRPDPRRVPGSEGTAEPGAASGLCVAGTVCDDSKPAGGTDAPFRS